MARGVKTGGRKKGTPNKLTAATRDVIAEAAERLGGVDRLVEWAGEDKDNERAFWASIYPKLLPHDVNVQGADGGPVKMVIEWAKPSSE